MGKKAVALDRWRILVIGGICGRGDTSEAIVIDTQSTNPTWNGVSLKNQHVLPPHSFASATRMGQSVFLFGGQFERFALNQVFLLNLADLSVSKVDMEGNIPKERYLHTMTRLGDDLVLFKGFDGSSLLEDVHLLKNAGEIQMGGFSLSKDMQSLFINPLFSDISFQVEGKEIKAHKVVLSARSLTFREILASDSVGDVIRVSDIEFQVFHRFLNYIYTDTITLNLKIAPKILELARNYKIEHLEKVRTKKDFPSFLLFSFWF